MQVLHTGPMLAILRHVHKLVKECRLQKAIEVSSSRRSLHCRFDA